MSGSPPPPQSQTEFVGGPLVRAPSSSPNADSTSDTGRRAHGKGSRTTEPGPRGRVDPSPSGLPQRAGPRFRRARAPISNPSERECPGEALRGVRSRQAPRMAPSSPGQMRPWGPARRSGSLPTEPAKPPRRRECECPWRAEGRGPAAAEGTGRRRPPLPRRRLHRQDSSRTPSRRVGGSRRRSRSRVGNPPRGTPRAIGTGGARGVAGPPWWRPASISSPEERHLVPPRSIAGGAGFAPRSNEEPIDGARAEASGPRELPAGLCPKVGLSYDRRRTDGPRWPEAGLSVGPLRKLDGRVHPRRSGATGGLGWPPFTAEPGHAVWLARGGLSGSGRLVRPAGRYRRRIVARLGGDNGPRRTWGGGH
jgi:hypothetical protein